MKESPHSREPPMFKLLQNSKEPDKPTQLIRARHSRPFFLEKIPQLLHQQCQSVRHIPQAAGIAHAAELHKQALLSRRCSSSHQPRTAKGPASPEVSASSGFVVTLCFATP